MKDSNSLPDIKDKVNQLRLNIESISDLQEKISKKTSKVKTVSDHISQLSKSLNQSKIQRDINIGQNYIKFQQKKDKELSEQKIALEKVLIKIKEEYAKVSEQVQEQEDIIQVYVNTCKSYDRHISDLKTELDQIKVIQPPVLKIEPRKEEKRNTFSMNQPIQLNVRKLNNKRSESIGGFK